MSKRFLRVALALTLLLFACSDDPTLPSAGSSESPRVRDDKGVRTESRDRKRPRAKAGDGRSTSKAQQDGGARSRTGESGGSVRKAPRSAGGTAWVPAGGTYVYAQQGYEEFCQTTS